MSNVTNFYQMFVSQKLVSLTVDRKSARMIICVWRRYKTMGIRKKKNGEGSITARPDGRYNVSLGSVHTTVKDYKSAVAKLKELKVKSAREEPAIVKKTSVEKYVSDWLENNERLRLKPKSYERKQDTFENQVKPNIGHIQLCALNADDIQAMVNKVYQERSYSTAKKAHDCINKCMKLAVRKRHITYNPCEGVTMPRKPTLSVEDEELIYYSPEQVELVVKEATRRHSNGTLVYRYGYVILLLLATGMRVGEALYLKWKHVDFENRKLVVCGNVVEVKGRTIEQNTPKTSRSNRTIPLNDRAIESLRMLKELSPDSARVISTKNNEITSSSSIRRVMGSINRQCGITEIKGKVHALRHTFADMLIRGGVDIKAVSELLGHSSVMVTLNIYHHIIEEQRRDAVQKLDDFF